MVRMVRQGRKQKKDIYFFSYHCLLLPTESLIKGTNHTQKPTRKKCFPAEKVNTTAFVSSDNHPLPRGVPVCKQVPPATIPPPALPSPPNAHILARPFLSSPPPTPQHLGHNASQEFNLALKHGRACTRITAPRSPAGMTRTPAIRIT